MENDDVFCRLAYYPKCINADTGILDAEMFLDFAPTKKRRSELALSVVNKNIGVDNVHSCGIHIAKIKNERIKNKMKDKGEIYTQNNSEIYLYFYEIIYNVINSIILKYYHIDIIQRNENSFDAHYHIEMWLKDSSTNIEPRKLSEDEVLARNTIYNSLMGPIRTNIGPALARPELFSCLPEKQS